jgi:hypothetical protein
MFLRTFLLASVAVVLALCGVSPSQAQPVNTVGGGTAPVFAGPGAPVPPTLSGYNEYYASADLCDLQYDRSHDYDNDRQLRAYNRHINKRDHENTVVQAEFTYIEVIIKIKDSHYSDYKTLLQAQLVLVSGNQQLVGKDLERMNGLRADCRNKKHGGSLGTGAGAYGNGHSYGQDDQCGYYDDMYASLLVDKDFHDNEYSEIQFQLVLLQADVQDHEAYKTAYGARKDRYNARYQLACSHDGEYDDRYRQADNDKTSRNNDFTQWDSQYSSYKSGFKSGGGGGG